MKKVEEFRFDPSYIFQVPETMTLAPVTAAASSEAQKATASATSSNVPNRDSPARRAWGMTPPRMSPGETMLTVMPFPISAAAAVRGQP